MEKELNIIPSAKENLSIEKSRAEELARAFFSGRNARTLEAYKQDLEDFKIFLKAETLAASIEKLLGAEAGAANGLVLNYRAHLLERGLSPATINRRLAALRSFGKLARLLGAVGWAIEVGNVKGESYRDLRGPTKRNLKRVLVELSARTDKKARRDFAILRLLYDLGLRRNEVASLDLAHINFEAGSIALLGKGQNQRMALTLPKETLAAVERWLELRGREPGALFLNLSRTGQGGRLTGRSLLRVVRSYGLGRTHGIRHLAITEALDLTSGNLRAVQRFSRHKDVRVIGLYDDNRQDLGGDIARRLAESV